MIANGKWQSTNPTDEMPNSVYQNCDMLAGFGIYLQDAQDSMILNIAMGLLSKWETPIGTRGKRNWKVKGIDVIMESKRLKQLGICGDKMRAIWEAVWNRTE